MPQFLPSQVKDERTLMLALAAIGRINGNALFAFAVDADSADPTKCGHNYVGP